MIKFIEKLLSLIYIQPCYFCKSTKEDTLICSKCYSKIKFLGIDVFKKINDVNIYACTIYDEIIKKLIRDLKYHKQKQLAPLQAQIMKKYLDELKLTEDFLILPVPIHPNRKKERKYNHMDLVGEELSKTTGYKINKEFLRRIKDTQKQYKLNKQERIKNINGAFDIDISQSINKDTQLLIIDDITSTGITLEEIIKTLKTHGYNKITAITLATPKF